jgi:sugar (Glycoside-Pentoside-Hexuronide) transporter
MNNQEMVDISLNNESEITKTERVSYISFFVGQNLFCLLVTVFLMLYATDYVGISAAAVGTIFLIGRVVDAFLDPVVGIIIDKARFKRGKFKPWLLSAAIALAIIITLMFAPINGSIQFKTIYIGVIYILFGFAYAFTDIPIFGLSTRMTDDIAERGSLISFGRGAFALAFICITMLVMPFVKSQGWFTLAIVISVISLITMIPAGIFTKERIETKTETTSLKTILRSLTTNKHLLIFNISFVALNASTTIMTTAQSYFAIYNLGSDSYVGILGLVGLTPMVLIPLFMKSILNRMNKMQLMKISAVFLVIFTAIGYVIGYSNITVFLVLGFLRSIALGFMVTLGFMFTPDCIEYGAYKTGERTEAICFAVQTFIGKFAGALAGIITGIVLTEIGYVPNAAQSESALKGLWDMFQIYPAVAAVITCVLLVLFYKLKEKDVEVMSRYNVGQISKEEAETIIGY